MIKGYKSFLIVEKLKELELLLEVILNILTFSKKNFSI